MIDLRVRRLPLLAGLLFSASCAASGAGTAGAPTTDAWVAAHNRGDIESFVALYAPDAVLLPPNTPLNRGGREAVREIFTGVIRSLDVELEPVDRAAAGDVAYEVGRWTDRRRGGEDVVATGSYVVIWRRQPGGSWVVQHNAWSRDSAPGS